MATDDEARQGSSGRRKIDLPTDPVARNLYLDAELKRRKKVRNPKGNPAWVKGKSANPATQFKKGDPRAVEAGLKGSASLVFRSACERTLTELLPIMAGRTKLGMTAPGGPITQPAVAFFNTLVDVAGARAPEKVEMTGANGTPLYPDASQMTTDGARRELQALAEKALAMAGTKGAVARAGAGVDRDDEEPALAAKPEPGDSKEPGPGDGP